MFGYDDDRDEDYRDGPILWDADPDVCCAAYRLGACEHTESYAYDGEDWED